VAVRPSLLPSQPKAGSVPIALGLMVIFKNEEESEEDEVMDSVRKCWSAVVLCFTGNHLARFKYMRETLQKLEHPIVSVVLAGLGMTILLENGAFTAFVSLFRWLTETGGSCTIVAQLLVWKDSASCTTM